MNRSARCAAALVVFAAALALAVDAWAEGYPAQPIKLIVAQAPGGQNDTIARAFGQRLAERWKIPVVIINHGGVGGTIGAELAAKATADGYTLFFGGSNNLVLAPVLQANLRYNPTRDFVAIGGVARVVYALAVNASIPVRDVPELVAYARTHPGRLNYGSSGVGSTSALGAELLIAATGIDLVHIPYKGTAPAITELVAGHIDLMFADLSQLLPHSRTGTLRLIAAAGDTRSPAVPDLSTIGEQGITGVSVESWYGLLAPTGTPTEAIAMLTGALRDILREPEFRRRLEGLGYAPMDIDGGGFGSMIQSEITQYSAIIKRAGIKVTP